MPSSGSEQRPRSVIVGPLTIATVLWAAAGLVAWLALRTSTGQQLDEWALQAASTVLGAHRPHWFGLVLGALPIAASLAVGAAILTVAMRSRRILAGATILGMAGMSLLSVQVLKLLLLNKPDLGIQEATLNSSPSGHASLAAVAGFAWMLAVPRSARGWATTIGASLTTAIGAGTVLLGWHRPADVVAAILVCAGWSAIAGLALPPSGGGAVGRGLGAPMIAKRTVGLGALVAAIVLAAAPAQSPAAALVAGLLAIAATALLAFAAIASGSRSR